MKPPLPKQDRRPPLYFYLPALLVLGISLYPLIVLGTSHALNRTSDDAYYYIVIAQNIIASGESAFFPGELTNGYHPLWLAFLVVGGKVFGLSLVSVKVMEAFIVFSGFVIFIRFFKFRSFVEVAFYSAVVWRLFRSFGMDAMETSLLFLFLVLFFASLLSNETLIATRRGAFLLLTGALVIGSRLDAALFVVPLLAVSSISLRQKTNVFLALVFMGMLYTIVNHWIFGSAFPISGTVKSMGGFQINSAFLRQIQFLLNLESVGRLDPIALSFILAGIAAIAAIFLKINRPDSPISTILFAALAGFLFFEAKLTFLSSWRVWGWYGYPQLIFALPLIWLAVGVMSSRKREVMAVILTFLLVMPMLEIMVVGFPAQRYIKATSIFVEEYSQLLANRNVAMGDRAGQFAYLYEGNVFQLEGLVSGVNYLEELKKGGDLRQYLCARDIGIIVDYEPPRLHYETMDLNIIDPNLSSAKGATLKVYAREEIARYQNLEDWVGSNIENTMIYAWQLECAKT